jgi:hypothetical protein
MIKFNLSLLNPFKYENFIALYNWSGQITKNKSWEVELYYYAYEWFIFNVDFSWKGNDHAGPSFEIGLFGYNLSGNIHDNRHWDYENKCWETVDNDLNKVV